MIFSAELHKLEFGPVLVVGRYNFKVRKLHVKNAYPCTQNSKATLYCRPLTRS